METPEFKGECMNSKYDNLMLEAEKLYDEHVDNFTWMGERPYTFNYFLETCHPELVEELERLEDL